MKRHSARRRAIIGGIGWLIGMTPFTVIAARRWDDGGETMLTLALPLSVFVAILISLVPLEEMGPMLVPLATDESAAAASAESPGRSRRSAPARWFLEPWYLALSLAVPAFALGAIGYLQGFWPGGLIAGLLTGAWSAAGALVVGLMNRAGDKRACHTVRRGE